MTNNIATENILRAEKAYHTLLASYEVDDDGFEAALVRFLADAMHECAQNRGTTPAEFFDLLDRATTLYRAEATP